MRTLRTGLAAFFVTLVCSVGLVVGSASPAAAFDVGPIVKGATKASVGVRGGAAIGATVSNPVGWLVGAATLAWFAYDTKDIWLPIITGDHDLDDYAGNPGGDPDHPYGWTSQGQDTVMKMAVLSVTGNTATFHLECINMQVYFGNSYCLPNGQSVNYSSADSTAKYPASNGVFCKGPAGIVKYGFSTGGSQIAPINMQIATPNLTNKTWTQQICKTGETIVGFASSPRPDNASLGTQHFGIAWGHLSTLPVGTVTFDKYLVDVECTNGATSEVQHITSYTEERDGTVIPSCRGRLGDGWRMTGLTVTPTLPKIDDEPIPDTIEVPDFSPFEWDELIPEELQQTCVTDPDGCSLDVFLDGKRCYETIPDCGIWTKVRTKDPTRIECRWGTKTVDWRKCLALADGYAPTTTPTVTGTPQPTLDPYPQGDTGTPEADTSLPDPSTATEKTECFPSGWGKLNPFEWVYKPVKCAMVWAFVPKTEVSTRVDRMKTKLVTKVPFSWGASLAALPTSISGGGCPVDWAFTYQGTTTVLLCGTKAGNTIRAARPFITVLAMGACVYPFLRSLVYASVPIIKPSPGE